MERARRHSTLDAQPPASDNLVWAHQIGKRSKTTPDMNKAGKRKQKEYRHAQDHVCLEMPLYAGHQRGIGLKQHDALQVFRQAQHGGGFGYMVI